MGQAIEENPEGNERGQRAEMEGRDDKGLSCEILAFRIRMAADDILLQGRQARDKHNDPRAFPRADRAEREEDKDETA